MSAEQYRLLFASGNAHLSNVVFDAFVSAGRGRVEARLVSALAQARVFATRAPCDIVLLDATLGTDLLESIAEMRRERPDLLIAVLATGPTGSQRASYLNAGARLITAVPESHEETEALLVQVISALHALRQPVAPAPPPAPAPAPVPVSAPAPAIRRSDAPLFAAPQPPAAPAEAPAKPRDGLLFSAPAPAAPAPTPTTLNVRRSDAPLFAGPPPAKPVTNSIKPAAIRAAENAGLAGGGNPTAAKPSGTRTISLPVARPFAAPEPAPPAAEPPPPPVAKPAPEAPPAPAAEKDKPRTSSFRFTQLIKNIKPVSLPPKSEGGTGES